MKPFPLLALLCGVSLALSACKEREPAASARLDVVATTAAPKCDYPLVTGDDLDTPDAKVVLHDVETSDREAQSWVRASFMLKDHALRLTEAQARATLDRLYQRLASSCRAHPVQRGMVFLYPADAVAGQSSAWIGRLTASNARSNVELRRVLLRDDRTDRLACLQGKEPGKSLNLGTRLPAQQQRHTIGTWADPDSGLTMSFEKVNGKVYQVYRSAYCSSNERGDLVRQRSAKRFTVIDSANGDYFEMLPTGDLGVFDREGQIDIKPSHPNLFPAAPGDAPASG